MGPLPLVWAVVVGAAGFMATVFASMIQDANQGPMMGIFFAGPLGSLIGFIAAERIVKAAGGWKGHALGKMLLVTLVYGAAVFGVMFLL